MTVPIVTPYSSLEYFWPGAMPSWITSVLDQQRIQSYQIYEQIYWNIPHTFKLVYRGQEDKPIYIPTAKTIIEATTRYTAPEFGFTVIPRADSTQSVNSEVVSQATQAFNDLFTRERFWSKFVGNKRYGLIRGDWLWHIVADKTKAPGTRISIYPLDPASYFPIWHPDDLDRVIGAHIVDTFIDEETTETRIKRLTYRKQLDANNNPIPGAPITVEEAIFELDDWEGPSARPLTTIRERTIIAGITSLPVYHIKNFEEPANPFGSSELRGVERLLGAINQGVSDQELALSLEGLGLYATDAPNPTNDQGEETDWILGPGRVLMHPPGTDFKRVTGVSSIAPYQEHLGYLEKKLFQATGVSEAAMGIVDVAVAQSGISLQLQFQPMVAKTNEKDEEIKAVHDQMFFDFATQWFPTFEGLNFEGMTVLSRIGGKIPVDRVAKFTELNNMLDRKVISAAYYRQEASRLGYVFPETIEADITKEQEAATAAATPTDPFADRAAQELSTNGATGATAVN